jgi:xylulose-5-phosphate/fructose-6-phosphate phosphoketolase
VSISDTAKPPDINNYSPAPRLIQNEFDRFHLAQDVVDRLPHLGTKGSYLKQVVQDKLIEHKRYIDQQGRDLPEIQNWKWGDSKTIAKVRTAERI